MNGEPDLERLAQELIATGDRLVRLDKVPSESLHGLLQRAVREIGEHGARSVRTVSGPARAPVRLREEHERFRSSLEEFDQLLRTADGDPHGGNFQALGQYLRIFGEALERHATEERHRDSAEDSSRDRSLRAEARANPRSR